MTPQKKTFIIRKQRTPLNPQFAARRLADDADEENHGCLCFVLGALFGPIGLLIAAIIAKAKGLISALWGFVVSWLVFGLIWVAAIFVISRQ